MSLCFVLVLVVKKRKGCNEADALSPMRRDGTSITSGRECGRERSSLGANLCNGERMPLVLFPSATKLPLARSARMRSNATWRRCGQVVADFSRVGRYQSGVFPSTRLSPIYAKFPPSASHQLASNFSIIMGTVLARSTCRFAIPIVCRSCKTIRHAS